MRCRINKQRRIFLGVAALALALIGFSFFHIHHDTSAKEVSEDSYGDPIDVTITDRVNFNVEPDSNIATVSDIAVTNNSSNFALDISNIKATAATGYTLNTYNTDYSSFAVDSKHLGLAYAEGGSEYDLSIANGHDTEISLDVNSNSTLGFKGKSSSYSAAVSASENKQSASIVLTLKKGMEKIAMFTSGSTVNCKMKALARGSSSCWGIDVNTYDDSITSFRRSENLPNDFIPSDINTISADGYIPIYAWFDNGTIYYYSTEDKIYLNYNASYMFVNLRALQDFGNISDIDTSKTINMQEAFSAAGHEADTFTLDLSGWNTSNVTNMYAMFQSAGYKATSFTLDLSGWDTSSVESMSCMFRYAGNNSTTFTTDLSGLNTSNVTSMYLMFESTGYRATTWSIGDISNWNTSKVTNMSEAFRDAGYSATAFTLDLSGWDTSSVTNMSQMFLNAGWATTDTWSIDLSGWDTSSVTNMRRMFGYAGYKAASWSIEGLSGWNTSSVTDTSYMFYGTGGNATTWSIGDLSGWDTSKVTNMGVMFNAAGYSATTWSVGDISGWDTSSVTNMTYMFYDAGYEAITFTLDLSDWDTSKVTNMDYMFEDAGYSATTFILNLSGWNTSNVTTMNSMFYRAGNAATTWSVTIPKTNGNNIDNTNYRLYGKDSDTFAYSLNSNGFILAP